MVGNDPISWVDILGLQGGWMPSQWHESVPTEIIDETSEGVKKQKSRDVCKCIEISIYVLTDTGGLNGAINPFDNGGFKLTVGDADKNLPITSGHSKKLDPKISVKWKDDDPACKCKKQEKDVVVRTQIYDKKDGDNPDVESEFFHNIIYSPHHINGGWAPDTASFSHSQLGVRGDKGGVGKTLRVTVSVRGKICVIREFTLSNAGGTTNNIPGFVNRPG